MLRVANWGGAREGNADDKRIDEIYREFERQNPGVVVREEPVPGGEYVQKMSLAYIAHAQPDVMMLDLTSAAVFINSHMVCDLYQRARDAKELRRDEFFPKVWDAYRRGRALYAIPQDFTPMVVYYNKRLFDKAHVPYPTSDWNFSKFRETAARLTIPGQKADDPAKQYGFAFSNWAAGWVMWIWNLGGNYLSLNPPRAEGYLDSPHSIKAVTFLRDLVQSGYSPSISQTATLGVSPFENGTAAMEVSGHWSMVGFNNAGKGPDGKPTITLKDLGIVALPHDISRSQTVMYEAGFSISAQSQHKNLAWKFIQYMCSRRVQSKYQTSGIAVCARKDVSAERARNSPLEAQFLPIIPDCRPPYGSRVEGYEFVEDHMTKAMESILESGREPSRALEKAARDIDREFRK